ncbi:MAG: hypothetical protein Q4B81_00300 [Moraxella sp.]|nr:hypothetical protein [Moraxella sp.]
MFGMNHDFAERLKAKKQEKALFDGIDDAIERIEFDPVNERQAIADIGNLRMAAMWVVVSTTKIVSESDADDEDVLLPNEVLDSLTLEALDLEEDGEMDDVDGVLRATMSAHIADAYATLGVDDGVIDDMFSSDMNVADSAIETAAETVLDNLPDDGDELDALFSQFAYGYSDDEDAYDGMMMDKVAVGKTTAKKFNGKNVRYKAVRAVRNGKVTIVNKRIGGGKIVLSAKQKAALKKARAKSRTGSANARRLRSVEKGIRKGIYGKSLQKNKSLLRMSRAGA